MTVRQINIVQCSLERNTHAHTHIVRVEAKSLSELYERRFDRSAAAIHCAVLAHNCLPHAGRQAI